MASRNILITDVSFAAADRAARMPAWFDVAPRTGTSVGAATNVASDSDWSWLETDCGVEVIEHQVPAELLAALFGKSAAASLRA